MRSRLATACLTGGLLAALSAPTVAVTAIPDEAGFGPPLGARSAIVGDVDGDGVRELVAIRRWQNDPGRLAVEVIRIDDSGRLSPGGQVLLRRHASPEDLLTGGARPDDEGMLVVGAAEPARLLAWRVDGVERVIVAGVGTEGLPRPSGPTLWEVGLDPSGATELRFLYDSQAAGSSIHAIDLDGDGTDELVIGEPPETESPSEVQLRILRWDGAAFSKASFYLTPALGSDFAPLGNSDGRPGEELGIIAVPNEANLPALLHRISLDDGGAPRTELVHIPFVGELAAMVGSDGGRILLASPGEGLRLFDWPAGGELTEVATSPQRGFPLAVLGTGADARLLLRDEGIVHVLDEDLTERGVIRRSAAAAQFRNSFLAPFGGQVPGGLADGRPAVVFRGRLVTLGIGAGLDGNPLDERVVAALPGIWPIGI
ncbi:MAG TPA: FG-GAP repeat protein, partial [Candidatus Binatia bacterium]|nr:FG-GAP repeat protein [Candidatus Binatia bacterium]